MHAWRSLWLSVSVLSSFSSWRIRLPGAEKGSSAPGGKKKLLLGAERGHSAPGGKKKLLPGAEKGSSAPGGKKKQLPGAKKGLGALGGGGIESFGARERVGALKNKKATRVILMANCLTLSGKRGSDRSPPKCLCASPSQEKESLTQITLTQITLKFFT